MLTIHAAHDPYSSRVALTIADNGCGMDQETVKRAFDPFFSAKPAGRRRGMGLPKALRWVESSGGRCGWKAGRTGNQNHDPAARRRRRFQLADQQTQKTTRPNDVFHDVVAASLATTFFGSDMTPVRQPPQTERSDIAPGPDRR